MDLIKKINLDKIRNAAEDVINQAKPKSDVEARMHEALSHKNWGTSSTLMNEIARDTFDYERYATITKIIWESLQNTRPAAWRVVFKAMTLLEHLIKNGSERCVDDARNHSHLVRSLFNFNYYEGTTDRGIGVREKAKQLAELLGDDERVREERSKAKQLREKFGGNLGGVSSGGGGGYGGGGSGGGGGSSYAGYGNDSYGGYDGGSSGYGDSGIGSTSGFSGRYNDTSNDTSATTSAVTTAESNSPNFATAATKKKKKSKKAKKKKDKSESRDEPLEPAVQVQPPAPAPEIDLLAMGDTSANGSGFDAFQSAPTEPTKTDSFDAFGAPSEPPKSNSFDVFGDMQSAQQKSEPQFDAFSSSAPVLGNTSTLQPNSFDAFGTTNNKNSNIMNSNMNNSMNNNVGNVNNMFGHMSMNNGMSMNNSNNMSVTQNQNFTNNSINNIMGGGKGQTQVVPEEDDFGDFADGNSKPSIDPLNNLISLDGLTKNSKKDDKTNQPVIFNAAAQNFIQNQDQITSSGQSKLSVDLAFSGVDGLNKSPRVTQSMTSNNQGSKSVMKNSNMTMNNGMNMGMNNGMNMGMNNMSQMGQRTNGSNMNGMNMGMMATGNMNNFGNNMSMNSMGVGGTNNNVNSMNGSMNSMMGGHNMMGGQQRNNMMGGQQGNNMMGGQQGNNMMGGQPMGGW